MATSDGDRWIDVDGLPVRLQGRGTDTVLMVHGWPDTLALWDGTVAALQDGYRCARLTLPGFDIQHPLGRRRRWPRSRRSCRVIDRISPDHPVTLLVHDWGCLFGYELAQRHPQGVARVVGVDVGDHNSKALAHSWQPQQKLAVIGYQVWLALAWAIGGTSGPGGRRDVADHMTAAMARWLRCPSSAEAIHAGMNYPYAMRWLGTSGGLGSALEADLPMPMLYLYGTRKPFMFQSPDWLARLAAQPDSAVQPIRTGHWVMTSDLASFSAAVRSWLDSTPSNPAEAHAGVSATSPRRDT